MCFQRVINGNNSVVKKHYSKGQESSVLVLLLVLPLYDFSFWLAFTILPGIMSARWSWGFLSFRKINTSRGLLHEGIWIIFKTLSKYFSNLLRFLYLRIEIVILRLSNRQIKLFWWKLKYIGNQLFNLENSSIWII